MSTDQNTIDAYNSVAEKWSQLQKGTHNIPHYYVEKPAMRSLIPDINGKDILCVGCGTGEECANFSELGARKVVGFDISEKLIENAQNFYKDNKNLEFIVGDIETFNYNATFDFAYSSLVLHYLEDWTTGLKQVSKHLNSGAKFIFSVSHPILKAGEHIVKDGKKINHAGYAKFIEDKEKSEVYGDYLTPRREDNLEIAEGLVVTQYYKPISLMVKQITQSGFYVTNILEPKPLEEVKNVDKRFWEIYSKFPQFIIFEIEKL